MPLSDVIKSFRTGSQAGVYYATRITDQGFDADGYALPPITTSFKLEAASVQPIARDYLQVLPDGIRIEDTQIIFTATLLHSTTATQRADVVNIEGTSYTVVSVAGPFELGSSKHYEVIAVRQTGGTS